MKRILSYISWLAAISLCAQNGNLSFSSPNTQGGTTVACQSIRLTPGFSFSATATNKTLILKVDPTQCDPYGGATANLSQKQNYIRTITYTSEDGTRYLDQIDYYDGLGRPMETVQRGITPQTADLITYQEYDAFGRESKAWLPAVASGNNGAFMPQASQNSKATSTYSSDPNPYSQLVYESSPLNRVLEQYGPGKDWHAAKKGINTDYLTNAATGELACINYISSAGEGTTITSKGNYGAGQLYVTRIKDEDARTSYEFKDKLGQVVLTRQIGGNNIQYDTYYIYDDFGNLRMVLPPTANDSIAKKAAQLNPGSFVRSHLAYIYYYDNRNRCTLKKIPGIGWIYYVYDKADRLIFSQDPAQYARKEWTFNKYDAFGRIIITGTYSSSQTQAQLITKCANIVVKEKPGAGAYGYTKDVLTEVPITDANVYQVNYYDDYELMPSVISSHTDFKTLLAYTAKAGYGKQYINSAIGRYTPKGLLVGSRTKNFKADGTIENTRAGDLATAYYYDERGRLIQTKSTNHLRGVEEEYIAYNFIGQPTRRMHVHTAASKTTQTEVYAYSYDHAGRLIETRHKLNTMPETVLAYNEYDELGRLKKTTRASNSALATTYDYNIRSWTKKINGTLFQQELFYNTTATGNKLQYGGNISAMTWKVQGENQRTYRFEYDDLSRIEKAAYDNLEVTKGGKFSTSYEYDKQGNITKLERRGKKDIGTNDVSYALVDNLSLTYNGNQLVRVIDKGVNVTMDTSADFKDKDNGNTTQEYTYNENGALKKDLNKGISLIEYNSLNLPRLMHIKNMTVEGTTEYTYSANGQKLRVVQKHGSGNLVTPLTGSTDSDNNKNLTKITDYVGNKIYEQGILKRILVDGGYIENNVYYFYQQDHLGNNRVVADAQGTVIQKTHYYPFGMAFAEGTTTEQGKQPYKYNGKELDTMDGLNWYDYSARHYDPAIARFSSIDPLSEKYYSISPYAYVNNNPLKYIDPTGMDTVHVAHDGRLTDIKYGGNDILNITNEKGNVISQNFGNNIFKEYGADNYKGLEYAYFSANNPKDSEALFTFLANNTSVEWSNSTIQHNDNSKSYFVATSHQTAVESGFAYLSINKELYDVALLKQDHNHPATVPYPSGASDSRHTRTGDIPVARQYVSEAIRRLQPIPRFRIYVPGKGYRPYFINTTLKQFNNMPNYYYEKK